MRGLDLGNPFRATRSYSGGAGKGDGWRRNPLRPFRVKAGSVLVALVQGIIGAGDKHLAPLQQCRRKKARYRAKDDFLEKGGLHGPFYEAEAVPRPGLRP